MNKIPRFMKEYANYKIKYMNDGGFTDSVRVNAIKKIEKTLLTYSKEAISITEAMDDITHCIDL